MPPKKQFTADSFKSILFLTYKLKTNHYICGGDDGNRTRVDELSARCIASVLHPQIKSLSDFIFAHDKSKYKFNES